MAVKYANFVVVHLGDTDHWGFDEVTLPMLARLVDSCGAQGRQNSHLGVTAFYLASPGALGSVERLVAAAEALREGNPRFQTLGIGLSYGPMIAEFDWRGRPKGSLPMGTATTAAGQMIDRPGEYRDALAALRRTAAAPGGIRADFRD